MTQLVEKKVKLKLGRLSSNAFSLMGAFQARAKQEGWSYEEIDTVLEEAKDGDHDHLVAVLSAHCVNDGK